MRVVPLLIFLTVSLLVPCGCKPQPAPLPRGFLDARELHAAGKCREATQLDDLTGWKPGSGACVAQQLPDGRIVIQVRGVIPTPNYRVHLALNPLPAEPPTFTLYFKPSPAPDAQVVTTYDACFFHRDTPDTRAITIVDLDHPGGQSVKVKQIR